MQQSEIMVSDLNVNPRRKIYDLSDDKLGNNHYNGFKSRYCSWYINCLYSN